MTEGRRGTWGDLASENRLIGRYGLAAQHADEAGRVKHNRRIARACQAEINRSATPPADRGVER